MSSGVDEEFCDLGVFTTNRVPRPTNNTQYFISYIDVSINELFA